jgi:hypothetical protein
VPGTFPAHSGRDGWGCAVKTTTTDTEAAIQAEIPAVIKDLRAIQKRLRALAKRTAALPGYAEGMAANAKSEECYVATLALSIHSDLCWVAGVDQIEERAIAEAIDRLKDCMATTVEDCARATVENVERHRGEVQESAARLAKRAEEFAADFGKEIERLVRWAGLLPAISKGERGYESAPGADRSADWLQIFCAIEGVQINDLPMLKEMAEHLRDAANAKD